MAEYDCLDGGSGSGEGSKEDADMSPEFRVSKEGKEFLSGWGKGFGHFLVVSFLDSFCFLIRDQEFLSMGKVSL